PAKAAAHCHSSPTATSASYTPTRSSTPSPNCYADCNQPDPSPSSADHPPQATSNSTASKAYTDQGPSSWSLSVARTPCHRSSTVAACLLNDRRVPISTEVARCCAG